MTQIKDRVITVGVKEIINYKSGGLKLVSFFKKLVKLCKALKMEIHAHVTTT